MASNKTGGNKKLINMINKEMKREFVSVHIPFLEVNCDWITLESYFLNYEEFNELMGSNVTVLTDIVEHSIAKVLATDLYNKIQSSNSFIGRWDYEVVYNLVKTNIHISTLNNIHYIALVSALKDLKTFSDLPIDGKLEFGEYNPEKFTEFCDRIMNVVLNTAESYMSNNVPRAFAHGKSSINTIFYERFHNTMEVPVQNFMRELMETIDTSDMKSTEYSADYLKIPATEKQVQTFVNQFDKPFLTMMYGMLAESGLSLEVINDAITSSRVHMSYEDPLNRKLYDLKLDYKVVYDDQMIIYESSIGELVTMGINHVSKTKAEQYGRKLKKFYTDFVSFVSAVYLKHKLEIKKAEKEES